MQSWGALFQKHLKKNLIKLFERCTFWKCISLWNLLLTFNSYNYTKIISLFFSVPRGVHHCCPKVWPGDPYGSGHPVPAGWPVWAERVSHHGDRAVLNHRLRASPHQEEGSSLSHNILELSLCVSELSSHSRLLKTALFDFCNYMWKVFWSLYSESCSGNCIVDDTWLFLLLYSGRFWTQSSMFCSM